MEEDTTQRSDDPCKKKEFCTKIRTYPGARRVTVKNLKSVKEKEGHALMNKEEIPPEIHTDPGNIRTVQTKKEVSQANTERKILEIGIDGRYTWYNTTGHPTIVDDEIKAYVLEEKSVTPNLQPLPFCYKEDKLFTCPECGKSFARKLDRVMHRRIHTGQKPFTCAQCGKTFPFKCDLERHEAIHTAETMYKCLRCDRSFTSKYYLIRHEKTHMHLK